MEDMVQVDMVYMEGMLDSNNYCYLPLNYIIIGADTI